MWSCLPASRWYGWGKGCGAGRISSLTGLSARYGRFPSTAQNKVFSLLRKERVYASHECHEALDDTLFGFDYPSPVGRKSGATPTPVPTPTSISNMNPNINIIQLVPTPDYVQQKQSLHGRKRKYVSSVSGLCLHFPFSRLPAVPGEYAFCTAGNYPSDSPTNSFCTLVNRVEFQPAKTSAEANAIVIATPIL